MTNINKLRRELLGQMAVVRERLDTLEAEIIKDGEVDPTQHVHEAFSKKRLDALGNLSFQIGMLVGIANEYTEAM